MRNQQNQEIREDIERLRLRITEAKPPVIPATTRYVALVLIGTLARLLASEVDSQLLSQSLSNSFGGFV